MLLTILSQSIIQALVENPGDGDTGGTGGTPAALPVVAEQYSASFSTFGLTHSVPLPAASVVGDLVIVIAGTGYEAEFSTTILPAEWDWSEYQINTTTPNLKLFYAEKIIDGTEGPNLTFTLGLTGPLMYSVIRIQAGTYDATGIRSQRVSSAFYNTLETNIDIGQLATQYPNALMIQAVTKTPSTYIPKSKPYSEITGATELVASPLGLHLVTSLGTRDYAIPSRTVAQKFKFTANTIGVNLLSEIRGKTAPIGPEIRKVDSGAMTAASGALTISLAPGPMGKYAVGDLVIFSTRVYSGAINTPSGWSYRNNSGTNLHHLFKVLTEDDLTMGTLDITYTQPGNHAWLVNVVSAGSFDASGDAYFFGNNNATSLVAIVDKYRNYVPQHADKINGLLCITGNPTTPFNTVRRFPLWKNNFQTYSGATSGSAIACSAGLFTGAILPSLGVHLITTTPLAIDRITIPGLPAPTVVYPTAPVIRERFGGTLTGSTVDIPIPAAAKVGDYLLMGVVIPYHATVPTITSTGYTLVSYTNGVEGRLYVIRKILTNDDIGGWCTLSLTGSLSVSFNGFVLERGSFAPEELSTQPGYTGLNGVSSGNSAQPVCTGWDTAVGQSLFNFTASYGGLIVTNSPGLAGNRELDTPDGVIKLYSSYAVHDGAPTNHTVELEAAGIAQSHSFIVRGTAPSVKSKPEVNRVGSNSGYGATATAAVPNTEAYKGNLIILHLALSTSRTISTVPSGFVRVTAATALYNHVFYRIADGSGNLTVTVALTSSTYWTADAIMVKEGTYSGVPDLGGITTETYSSNSVMNFPTISSLDTTEDYLIMGMAAITGSLLTASVSDKTFPGDKLNSAQTYGLTSSSVMSLLNFKYSTGNATENPGQMGLGTVLPYRSITVKLKGAG